MDEDGIGRRGRKWAPPSLLAKGFQSTPPLRSSGSGGDRKSLTSEDGTQPGREDLEDREGYGGKLYSQNEGNWIHWSTTGQSVQDRSQ
jgi:hypothetical protein